MVMKFHFVASLFFSRMGYILLYYLLRYLKLPNIRLHLLFRRPYYGDSSCELHKYDGQSQHDDQSFYKWARLYFKTASVRNIAFFMTAFVVCECVHRLLKCIRNIAGNFKPDEAPAAVCVWMSCAGV